MEQNNNEIEKNDGNEELSTFNSQLSTKNNIYPIFDRMLAREDKEDLLKQHSVMIWFTGLSGSGKSTIAIALERELHKRGLLCRILDGDNIRSGINNNLGFSEADRVENIRRIAEVSKLFIDSGIITIAAFISPNNDIREMAANIIGQDDFLEIYVSTPLAECEKRDVKGLYAKDTSTSIMEMKELPERLVIVGGGYIGLEFASMYASFGTKVTVLESYPQFISREDRDIADSVKETLEKKGISFILNAKVQEIKGNTVVYRNAENGETHVLDADAILLATGRRPNTRELRLEAAGVEVNERGAIIVDEFLKTTNPQIRAIGDVKGGLQFTYISLDDYRIIREDLFGKQQRTLNDRDPVSYSVFIDPPLSRIGMSEEEARKTGRNFKVNKLPVTAIPRAKTLGETDGLFKVIIDTDTNRILGCTLFGPESSEIINLVAFAMKTGQEYTFLRDFIFTHPSMSESLNDLMNI